MGAAVGILGSVVSLVGNVVSASAQQQMVNEQTAASKRAENAREQQMQLDAQRRRRQAVRESLLARSMSLSAGVNQGAQYGTGVAGGMAGAVNQGLENQQGINSGEILGSRIFQANRDYFDATQRGQAGMAMGQGISAIGGAITNNAGAIGRLGGGGATPGPSGTPQYQTFGTNATPAAPVKPPPLPTYNRGRGIQTYGRNFIV